MIDENGMMGSASNAPARMSITTHITRPLKSSAGGKKPHISTIGAYHECRLHAAIATAIAINTITTSATNRSRWNTAYTPNRTMNPLATSINVFVSMTDDSD
jgi:hypothetical protein